MPNILVVIPPQNFELIRDRIAEIIADEMIWQAAMGYDDDLILDGVYVERVWPVSNVETTIINVMVKGGNYDNKDVEKTDGTYTYIIDIYTTSKSTDEAMGDHLSRLKMHKIFGKLRYIFDNPIYRTLGFAAPFNCRSSVAEFLVKSGSEGDGENIMTGRLHLMVTVPETVELLTPRVMDGYQTQVKLYETEQGYFYSS